MRRHVVVDTNVLVSGLLTRDPASPLGVVVDGMLRGRFPLLLSSRLVAEYREVLLRPRIQRLHGLVVAEVDELLTEIAVLASWRDPPAAAGDVNASVPVVAAPGVAAPDAAAPDPGDDHLWELRRSTDDAILVTGDGLLIERPPSFAAVMTPRAFAAFLADPSAG